MPRRKKTLEEHRLSGALDKNPGRFVDRGDSPVPRSGIGNAPRHLSDDEKKIWKEFVGITPEGVLGSSDAISLEIAVKMTLRMRTGKFDKTSEFIGLFNILSKLGLNPADRTKVTIPTKTATEEDPLADLD